MKFEEKYYTEEEYVKLVTDTIGYYSPHTKHNIIVCEEDNKIVAVFNAFTFAPTTLFLHYTWFSEEYKKKIKKLKYWTGFCNHIKELGYNKIIGIINNNNTPALIWALKTGWVVIGTRLDNGNNLLIEVAKSLEV